MAGSHPPPAISGSAGLLRSERQLGRPRGAAHGGARRSHAPHRTASAGVRGAPAAALVLSVLWALAAVSWAVTTTRDLGLIEPATQRTIVIAAKGLLEDGNEGEKVILGVQLQGGFFATAHISNAAALSLNKIRVEKSINLTTGWELVTTILDNERYNVVNSLCRGLNDTAVYWRLANMNTVFQAADVYFNVTVTPCTPSITSVMPDSGPREGGNRVTVVGHDLALSAGDVRVGAGASAVGPRALASGDVLSVAPDRSSVVVTVPTAAAGGVAAGAVTLRLASGTFGASTASYTFNPAVEGLAGAPYADVPSAGGTVTLSGTGFVTNDSTLALSAGGLALEVVSVEATRLVARVPARAAASPPLEAGRRYELVYTSALSGTFAFSSLLSWNPEMVVGALLPYDNGPLVGGNNVTISGANFLPGDLTGAASVGGVPCPLVLVPSASAVVVAVPAPANRSVAGRPLRLLFASARTGALELAYTYNGPAALRSVAPADGAWSGGTPVTVAATGVIPGDDSIALAFVGRDGAEHRLTGVRALSATSVAAVTPECSGRCAPGEPLALRLVSLRSGTVNRTAAFTYNPRAPLPAPPPRPPASGAAAEAGRAVPVVSGVEPFYDIPRNGTALTIRGSRFIINDETLRASIGGVPLPAAAAVPSLSITVLVQVPGIDELQAAAAAAGAPPLVQGKNYPFLLSSYRWGNITLPSPFSWNPDPAVEAILPSADASPSQASAIAGRTLSLVGRHFREGGTLTVFLGASECGDPAVLNATLVTCTTPSFSEVLAAPRVVDVRVASTRFGVALAPRAFTWNPAPSLAAVSPHFSGVLPSRLTGGNTYTVTGRGFIGGGDAYVSVDGALGAEVTVLSATTAVFRTPAARAGTPVGVPFPAVLLSTRFGTLSTAPAFLLQYDPPFTVAGIVPGDGPKAGGSVTLRGAGFPTGPDLVRVTLGGAELEFERNATGIVARVPPLPPGAATNAPRALVFESFRMGRFEATWAWNDEAAIEGVRPDSGPLGGGTLVTVTGRNLADGDAAGTLCGVPFGPAAFLNATPALVVFRAPDAIRVGPGLCSLALASTRFGRSEAATAYAYRPAAPLAGSAVFSFRIDVAFEAFGEAEQAALLARVAALLAILPARLVVLDKQRGSTIVTLELRDSSPEQQAAGELSASLAAARLKAAIASGALARALGPELPLLGAGVVRDAEKSAPVEIAIAVGAAAGVVGFLLLAGGLVAALFWLRRNERRRAAAYAARPARPGPAGGAKAGPGGEEESDEEAGPHGEGLKLQLTRRHKDGDAPRAPLPSSPATPLPPPVLAVHRGFAAGPGARPVLVVQMPDQRRAAARQEPGAPAAPAPAGGGYVPTSTAWSPLPAGPPADRGSAGAPGSPAKGAPAGAGAEGAPEEPAGPRGAAGLLPRGAKVGQAPPAPGRPQGEPDPPAAAAVAGRGSPQRGAGRAGPAASAEARALREWGLPGSPDAGPPPTRGSSALSSTLPFPSPPATSPPPEAPAPAPLVYAVRPWPGRR